MYEITAEESELVIYFSELALEQDLGEVIFTNFEIRKETIIGSNPTEYYYALFASDASGKYNSAIDLDKNNSSFNFRPNGSSIICSSTDCVNGCIPYQQTTLYGDKVWTCSSCIKPCKKTMVVVIKTKQL